jgi:hypothetical protein
MKQLLIALAVIFVLLVGGSVASGLYEKLRRPTYAELVADQVRAEQLQRDAALEAQWAPVRAAVWNGVLILGGVGALAYAGALAALHLRRTQVYAHPDAAGLLPVERSDQATARAALAAFHATRIEEARRPLVPAHYSPTITYSPSSELEYRHEGSAGLLPAGGPTPPAPAAVPSFGELLTTGRVGKGAPLLLGFDAATGAELPGTWTDLYATATAGLPGSGKTTSQRFFAAQTALHGARFVVCDPHAGAADDSLAATLAPLAQLYLCAPAEEPAAILEAVRYVADEGEARVRGRSADTTPIILWVDELTGLLGRSDVGEELAGLLEKIAQEYRKRFVYLSASGQIWTAARATSELRDSLASVLCHRMKRSQARLLLPTEEAATVERLATGEAVLWRTNGATARVRIPNTTAADVARVAELLAGRGAGEPAAPSRQPATAPSGAPSAARPVGFRPLVREGRAEGAAEGASATLLPAHPNTERWTPEEARIVAALASGKKPGELAEELSGAKGGRAYQAAAEKIAAVIARLAARGGGR